MLLACAEAPGTAGRRPAPPARTSVYLHPGQLHASRQASAVTTILGSCVSVCIWDQLKAIGGINHYLLPQGAACAPHRFGSLATAALVSELLALGAEREHLAAKVFGGALIADAFRGVPAGHLGAKNVERAVLALRHERIPIVAEDTGGRRGRKVIFQTDDGTAWVKEL